MSTICSDNLRQIFGFDTFRPGQEKVIDALLAGRSALAVFPTGGGKSLCYQLPALQCDGLTLVVSPLIALMKDQIDFLHRRGVQAARLDSTISSEEAKGVSQSVASGELKLLYVAPERFNNERFVAEMKRTKISLFAIDEAHCISEWGHNFRPDYLKLAETVAEIGAERVVALTATATPNVVEDIRRAFGIAPQDSVVTGFYRQNLQLLTTTTVPADRDRLLLSRLKERTPGPGIVYVTLQKTAESVAEELARNNVPARAYHAGIAPEKRHEVQEWWMEQPDAIVVATIAFGMGIDKADVRYVYHYNLPKSLESYSQEIGRAGRDGKPSTVEMFACREDLPTLENFVYGDTPSKESIRALVDHVASWPLDTPVPVAYYDLSQTFDMRLLVLRTAMTYLELIGFASSGTPIYTGYEIKPIATVSAIADAFPGVHGEFVSALFRVAKKGRIWFSVNPDEAARRLGVERRRVVRAIEVMEQQGLIHVRAGDVRTPYKRLPSELQALEVIEDLIQRFEKREAQEIMRLQQVVELVEHNDCQVNALVGYFGEVRSQLCGHCTFCTTKRRQVMDSSPASPIEVSAAKVRALCDRLPDGCQTARHVAKFLCGLSSPTFTRMKLMRDPLYGVLELVPFTQVLSWCIQHQIG